MTKSQVEELDRLVHEYVHEATGQCSVHVVLVAVDGECMLNSIVHGCDGDELMRKALELTPVNQIFGDGIPEEIH